MRLVALAGEVGEIDERHVHLGPGRAVAVEHLAAETVAEEADAVAELAQPRPLGGVPATVRAIPRKTVERVAHVVRARTCCASPPAPARAPAITASRSARRSARFIRSSSPASPPVVISTATVSISCSTSRSTSTVSSSALAFRHPFEFLVEQVALGRPAEFGESPLRPGTATAAPRNRGLMLTRFTVRPREANQSASRPKRVAGLDDEQPRPMHRNQVRQDAGEGRRLAGPRRTDQEHVRVLAPVVAVSAGQMPAAGRPGSRRASPDCPVPVERPNTGSRLAMCCAMLIFA